MIEFQMREQQTIALYRLNDTDEIELGTCNQDPKQANSWQITVVQNGADRVKLRRAIAQAYIALEIIKGIIP